MIPDWITKAAMVSPLPAIRLLLYVAVEGVRVPRPEGQVLAVRLSYEDIQRECNLRRTSIPKGVRFAWLSGYLRRGRLGGDRRMIYMIPVVEPWPSITLAEGAVIKKMRRPRPDSGPSSGAA